MSSERAVWIWRGGDLDGAVEFAQRHRVAELFVNVPWDLRRRRPERQRLARFVAHAHESGLRVSALGGTPDWGHRPADVVRMWLRPALDAAPFDGVHLDVEPDLSHDEEAGARALVALAETVRRQLPAAMSLEVDTRFWYPGVRLGRSNLARELLGPADCLTVMSYRHRTEGPDGSIALSRATAQVAREAGGAFRIGLETRDLGEGRVARKQTFFGRPRAELGAAIARLREAFVEAPGFRGVAVHDLPGWQALPREAGAD